MALVIFLRGQFTKTADTLTLDDYGFLFSDRAKLLPAFDDSFIRVSRIRGVEMRSGRGAAKARSEKRNP
jgi:transcription termination factor Rho